MQTCGNFIGVGLMLPAALLLGADTVTYYLAAGVIMLVAWVPISGWLFEVFANRSPRIGAEPRADQVGG